MIAPRFRLCWIIAILSIVGPLSGSFAKEQPVISPCRGHLIAARLSMETIRDESDNFCLRRRVFQVQVTISVQVQKQADLTEVAVF